MFGKPATIRAAYDATRRGGKVTLVGAAGFTEEATFPALSLMTDGKTIQGSVYGASDPPRDIPLLAELAQRGQLDLEALVTRAHRYRRRRGGVHRYVRRTGSAQRGLLLAITAGTVAREDYNRMYVRVSCIAAGSAGL